jgi:hypothetical protein
LDLSDRQIAGILKFVLGLSFLQVPISMYQRYFSEATGHTTGDTVTGTLMDSGCMTLILICVICVLGTAMLQGRIKKVTFCWMLILLLIPVSIDETKVTIFVFPPALLGTFLVASAAGKRVRVLIMGLAFMTVAGLIFVPLYNYFNELNVAKDEQFTVADILQKDFLSKYLSNGASVGNGSVGHVGRVEAVAVPLHEFARDPIKLTFGVGMGNASDSTLGPRYKGHYLDTLGPFVIGFSSGSFLIEAGLLGFALILMIHWMIFRDALVVSRQDKGLVGMIAFGWVGTTIVIFAGIFYDGIHGNTAMSYLYWFFSGVIVARRASLLKSRRYNTTQAALRASVPYLAANGVAAIASPNSRHFQKAGGRRGNIPTRPRA